MGWGKDGQPQAGIRLGSRRGAGWEGSEPARTPCAHPAPAAGETEARRGKPRHGGFTAGRSSGRGFSRVGKSFICPPVPHLPSASPSSSRSIGARWFNDSIGFYNKITPCKGWMVPRSLTFIPQQQRPLDLKIYSAFTIKSHQAQRVWCQAPTREILAHPCWGDSVTVPQGQRVHFFCHNPFAKREIIKS